MKYEQSDYNQVNQLIKHAMYSINEGLEEGLDESEMKHVHLVLKCLARDITRQFISFAQCLDAQVIQLPKKQSV